MRALEDYISTRESGPIFITKTGKRMDQPAAWRLVRRLARNTGVDVGKLNPHSFRHSFVICSASTPVRDVGSAA